MHQKIQIILITILTFGFCYAQPPLAEWTRDYDLESSIEEVSSVCQAEDGSFVIAGWTREFASEDYDYLVLCVDEDGREIWHQTYSFYLMDICRSVEQTADWGYILCGTASYYQVYTDDVCLVKTDREGNMQWNVTIGGDDTDYGHEAVQTSDGGYIVCGSTHSFGNGFTDYYLIKTDDSGNVEWQNTFGGDNYDVACDADQTDDGGYFIAGTRDHSETPALEIWKPYLVKTDADGNLEWEHLYEMENIAMINCAIQTSDGGYMMAGYTSEDNNPPHDVYVLKTDSQGNTEWECTYGDEGNDYANAIVQTDDGGYILTGVTEMYGMGGEHLYVLKIDGTGNIDWEKIFFTNGGRAIIQTQDGGYFVGGFTGGTFPEYSNFYCVKFGTEPQPEIALTITPENPSIVVPPEGGNVRFEVEITNLDSIPVETQIWLALDAPYGLITGEPFGKALTLNLAPGQTIQKQTSRYIRDSFSAGEFIMYAICGNYFEDPWVLDSFTFTKAEENTDFDYEASDELEKQIITCEVSPNPFNPTTNLSLEIQDPGEVSLIIYDVSGREVTRLLDGFLSAGKHEVIFDAENLTSGVYFAKLNSGDFQQTKKLLLVK